MSSFKTNEEAKRFFEKEIDRPIVNFTEQLGENITLSAFCHELGDGQFTNVYDISFPSGSAQPQIILHDKLTGVFNHVKSRPDIKAAMSGGFFFLADNESASPRQPSLNFALQDHRIKSLPASDKEALLVHKGRLTVEHLKSLGSLVIGSSQELSWSGSLTEYDSDVKIFSNGNSIIEHVKDERNGAKRILNEASRYTPAITTDDTVDIGLISRSDGIFEAVSKSNEGHMDIFAHDIIARTHERYIHNNLPLVAIRSIGRHALDGTLEGGISVGAAINTADFSKHPLNHDKSLGSNSPLQEIPMPRATIFETADNRVHLRLFDGRPGSETFTGITPSQAAAIVLSEQPIIWGSFLDSGQTAKLIAQQENDLESYGNRHYLQWPEHQNDPYIWVPKTGRPVSSMITLR